MECVFCQIARKEVPAYFLFEDPICIAFLDKYPQTRGHLQLIPKKHYRWVYEMPDMGKLFTTAGNIIRAIIPVLGASHVTLATFGHEVKHAHVWIVPQYSREVHVEERQKSRLHTQTQAELARILSQAIQKEVSS